jgi:hypothetical protein
MDAKLPPPGFPLGPPCDTAERIAGAILAFRPGALFVFDTR